MLKIYLIPQPEIQSKTIEESSPFVYVNDLWFNSNWEHGVDFYDKKIIDVMQCIDGAEYNGDGYCKSRYGKALMPVENLSSGCKAVINILSFKDKIFNISGCGGNALKCLFKYDIDAVLITSYTLLFNVDFSDVIVYSKNIKTCAKTRDNFYAIEERVL